MQCKTELYWPCFCKCAFVRLITGAAILTTLLATPLRAQGDPLMAQVRQLKQLSDSGNFRQVTQRSPNLAAEVRKRWSSKDFRDLYVLTIRLQANAHAMLGEVKQAVPLFKEAIDVTKKDYGQYDPGVGTISADLGNFYNNNARYADAARYIEDAIRIFKKNNQHDKEDGRITNLSNTLASIYFNLGRNTEAEKIYKEIISNYTRKHGTNNGIAALYLNNLGTFYQNTGQFEEAATFIKRALDIIQTIEPNSPGVATYSNNLASAYLSLSRIDDAVTYFEAAIGYEHRAHGPNSGATYHNNLGMLFLSLWISEKDPSRKARWYKGTRDNLTQAFDVELKTTGGTSLGVATYRINLGLFAVADGRYGEAEGLFQSALAVREQRLGRNDIAVAVPLIEWAWLDVVRNRVTTATVERSRRATQIMVPVIERELRLQQGSDAPVTIHPWATHLRVLYQAAELGLIGPQAAAEAFETAQRSRTTTISAAVNQTIARIGAATPAISQLVREHQDLTTQLHQLEAQLLSEVVKPAREQNAQNTDAVRAKIVSVTVRLTQLAGLLARDFSNYADFVAPRPVSLAEIQHLLGREEAMIFYHRSDRGDFVWAITHDKIAWREIALSNVNLDALLAEWRASFDNGAVFFGNKKRFDVESANKVYSALLGSVSSLIADKSHIIVVASGSLATFPFHLLVTEMPSRPIVEWKDYRAVAWLTRKHAVTAMPSPVSFTLQRKASARRAASKPYLAFGDPIFSDSGPPRLKDSADEVRAVAQIFGVPKSILVQRDATERAVKTMPLSDYRVLHFATHGYSAELAKRWGGELQPSIALTRPQIPSAQDDGFLTASEIIDLKLNADLVVISACESAAADKSGEALSGLARSFFYAGARALIVSYWDVDSRSAVRLMTRTLELLKQPQTLSPAQAMRQSMNEMIDDAGLNFNAYPGMWAPFGVLGLETTVGKN